MKKRLLIIFSIVMIIIFSCSSVLAYNDVPYDKEANPLETVDESTEEVDLISMAIKIVFYLIVFVLVLFLTFYGTKFFAKYSRNMGKGNNIEVIEHFNLGNNNKILAIKIYNKTYILFVNSNSTTVIDSFAINEDNSQNENSSNKMKFQKHLETILNTDEASKGKSSLNSKLLNMRMKVMQMKNEQHQENDVKEEEYEKKY